MIVFRDSWQNGWRVRVEESFVFEAVHATKIRPSLGIRRPGSSLSYTVTELSYEYFIQTTRENQVPYTFRIFALAFIMHI